MISRSAVSCAAVSDPVSWLCVIGWLCVAMCVSCWRLANLSDVAEVCPVFSQACVAGMFEYKDFAAFKQHLRDFLVQTKQFADENNADLFAEEAAQQQQVRDLRMMDVSFTSFVSHSPTPTP